MVCKNTLSTFLILSTFIILTVCISANEYASAESIERTAWDELWEGHMLAGTSLMLITPKAPRRAPYEGQFQKQGHIGDAHLFAQGIRIDDFHETQLWGLLSHGGWRLEGGVLGRAELLRGTVELYGKCIWRTRPVLFTFGLATPRSARNWYEFFLLFRPNGAESAELIRKWTISPDRIPYDYPLLSRFEYDHEKSVARVVVYGQADNKVFLEEAVEVSANR